ncbi:MAG: hypothetical protein ACI8UR_000392 [Natronomonas sp.]|jgi:hypothetical protein|uniref:HPP family protein n=1 Tax=Natronomonas sp. TaxID=2184060 RepID=UPI003989E5F8
MLNRLRERASGRLRRVGQLGRRLLRTGRRRLEETNTLIHVSILLFVPFLVALLTYLSNRLVYLSFFVFPPLAAGTYAMFANPESEYASPVRFVTGLTAGALCAVIAMQVAIHVVYPTLPPSAIEVDAPGAAFAVLLTGAVTWLLDIEEAAAFSMALLGLLVDPSQQVPFVLSVFIASSIVAGVFTVWHDLLYEQRAEYLYQSTKGDDHVLVPIRGDHPRATAMLAGRLAAAHDAGKVVLLDVVEEDDAEADAETTPEAAPDDTDEEADPELTATVSGLEELAGTVEGTLDVPCQVVVATRGQSAARTVQQTAVETNCDLIAAPYETEDGEITPFIGTLLKSDLDVLVHRSETGQTDWQRIAVPVRSPSDTAHAMIDFAHRIAGATGRVSVAHCIDSEKRRRAGDRMLANLVETAEGRIETHVANASVERFLRRIARTNDLVIIGASRDRSRASRLISPPTFERLQNLDTDIAIVDRR